MSYKRLEWEPGEKEEFFAPKYSAWGESQTHCKRGHVIEPGSYYVTKDGSRLCKKCVALRRAGYLERDKLEAMRFYSHGEPRCLCCGNIYLPHLQISYIDDAGINHMKLHKIPGGRFYHWLIVHHFPTEFHVRCFNCHEETHTVGPDQCVYVITVIPAQA